VNVNFSKTVAKKGMTRKPLNMVVVHLEGLRHPPIFLFDTLFSCHCPYNVSTATQKITEQLRMRNLTEIIFLKRFIFLALIVCCVDYRRRCIYRSRATASILSIQCCHGSETLAAKHKTGRKNSESLEKSAAEFFD
jgi:hypothetical protein